METTPYPSAEVSLIRLMRNVLRNNDQIFRQLKFFREILGKLNIGIFIHDLEKLRHIWTNNNFISILGYTDAEIRTFGPEWVKDNFHPDDLHILKERTHFFRQNKGDNFSGMYRVRHKLGHWVWIYNNCAVFKRDENGMPGQIIGISIDFSAGFKGGHVFKEFQRENQQVCNYSLIASLTSREKETLAMIASGRKDKEIADKFHISIHTVHTHRKNLLLKLNLHNAAELAHFAADCGLD